MKKVLGNWIVTSLLLTAVFSGNVFAQDAKTVGGNACKAYFGNQQEDMSYERGSIHNNNTAHRWVSCPIVREHPDRTDGLNYVRVWIRNQSPKVSRCVLISYSPEGTIRAFDGDKGQGDTNLIMRVDQSDVDGIFSLRCYIPSGARVLTIRHEEHTQ